MASKLRVNQLEDLAGTKTINVSDLLDSLEGESLETVTGQQSLVDSVNSRVPYLDTIDEVNALSSIPTGQYFCVSGGFVRWDGSTLEPLTRIPLRAFGAKGDGVTDDSTSYLDAISSGWPVSGTKGDSYLVTTTSQLEGLSVDFNGNGCEFLLGNTELLNVKSNFIGLTDIVSFTETTEQLSDGTTGQAEVTVLEVANAGPYSSGDIVKILSDDTILGESSGKRRAEYAQVFSVSGNNITLFTRVRGVYSTSPRLVKLDQSNTIKFHNCKVTPSSQTVTWSTPAMRVIGYVKPSFGHIEFRDLLERALLLHSCYRPSTFFLKGERIRTSQSNDAFGYLIHEVSCHAGYHHRPEGRDVRHVYSCSAFSTGTLDTSVESYGGTTATTVDHGYGFNCKASAFDTHADGEEITFTGCVAESPYKGNLGALFNFGLRGRKNKCVGCTSIGGNGFRAFSDFGHVDNSRDHAFLSCTHTFNRNETEPRAAFEVLGTSSGVVSGVVAKDITVNLREGSFSSIRAEWGDITVYNPTLNVRQTDTGDTFQAVAGGTIKSFGGSLDYNGATGSSLRTIRCFNDDSYILVDGLRIEANNNWALLVDMGSANGKVFARNIDVSQAPSFNSTGVSGDSGSPTISVDWVINGGVDGSLSHMASVVRGSSGGFPVQIGYRASPVVYYTVRADTSGVIGSSFDEGHFYGQELVFRNHPDSTNSVDLQSGTNGDFGSTETISPGKAYRVRWDGFNWTSA